MGPSEYGESHQTPDFDMMSSSKHLRSEKYRRSRSRSRKVPKKKSTIYRRGTDAALRQPESRIRSNSHVPRTNHLGKIIPLKI